MCKIILRIDDKNKKIQQTKADTKNPRLRVKSAQNSASTQIASFEQFSTFNPQKVTIEKVQITTECIFSSRSQKWSLIFVRLFGSLAN